MQSKHCSTSHSDIMKSGLSAPEKQTKVGREVLNHFHCPFYSCNFVFCGCFRDCKHLPWSLAGKIKTVEDEIA